jgi:hypothetical protein
MRVRGKNWIGLGVQLRLLPEPSRHNKVVPLVSQAGSESSRASIVPASGEASEGVDSVKGDAVGSGIGEVGLAIVESAGEGAKAMHWLHFVLKKFQWIKFNE